MAQPSMHGQVVKEAKQASGRGTALPDEWRRLWGYPAPRYRNALRAIKEQYEELARGISVTDATPAFADLVGPQDNLDVPLHRWFPFKEAFSYRLPGRVLDVLGAGRHGVVLDVFAGVATTPLALQADDRVEAVIGIEYSPLATFVGQTKVAWKRLDPRRLRRLLDDVVRFPLDPHLSPPPLAAFHNDEVFRSEVRSGLISASRHLQDIELATEERDFFLVGLAAIVEDVSGIMKDGRALRILRGRERKFKGLLPAEPVRWTGDAVRDALTGQWLAMIEDLEDVQLRAARHQVALVEHSSGDARDLKSSRGRHAAALGQDAVGIAVYSPPYPNCIDYSEVYKLELWLLGLVASQEEFRQLRLGTLRSHPSIEFPRRGYLDPCRGAGVAELVAAISEFVRDSHARSDVGPMIANYFDDMFQVFREQARVLEPGGASVCVIGNSTFSRRRKMADGYTEEIWRLPLLTDVILARLGELAGLEIEGVWWARDLRARNVEYGAARESLLVLRKPDRM